MANALEQPLDGLLLQSEYEAQHAVPPAGVLGMRQGFSLNIWPPGGMAAVTRINNSY
jgi:hypothetical protein